MQSVWQNNFDNAISKTINMPSDADEGDISRAFMYAYKKKCKGITIYRDQCRQYQPMSLDTSVDSSIGHIIDPAVEVTKINGERVLDVCTGIMKDTNNTRCAQCS